jgi:hypothetical protein
MINRIIYTTLSLILTAFISLSVMAQDGGTTIRATIDRSKILIGEPIQLRLEADIPENQPIRFFQLDSIPHFEFLSIDKIDTVNTSSGTVLSQQIRITSFDSGHWVIPSFILFGKTGTDTLPIDVGYTPFDTTQPYHDIKDIIEVKPPEEKEKFEWWLYVIPAIVVILLLIIILSRKKKKPVVKLAEPPPDPYKVAMEGLQKLKGEKNDAKLYYTKLVDIFRYYVSEKKGIHSLQQTSDDLIVQLQSLNMPKSQYERLAQALRMSDFVKFAKFVPTPTDDQNSFDTIKQLIDYIEQMK